MQPTLRSVAVLGLVIGLGTTTAAPQAAPPDATTIVNRACDAAGGYAAFSKLGVLRLNIDREEVMADGKTTRALSEIHVSLPGPIPGRLKLDETKTVAGDDGSGGWALINGQPDTRQAVEHMVRRTMTSQLFSILLPFSLKWEGVAVSEVEAGMIAGRPVWRIRVVLTRAFFDSNQISRDWLVDFDQQTYAVVQAISPATDLGKGLKADGMLITGSKPVKVGGVSLPGEEKIIGLDQDFNQNSHRLVKRATYQLVPASEAGNKFSNPIPPNLRPKPRVMEPPQLPPAAK